MSKKTRPRPQSPNQRKPKLPSAERAPDELSEKDLESVSGGAIKYGDITLKRGASSGDPIPTESISFNFDKMAK